MYIYIYIYLYQSAPTEPLPRLGFIWDISLFIQDHSSGSFSWRLFSQLFPWVAMGDQFPTWMCRNCVAIVTPIKTK